MVSSINIIFNLVCSTKLLISQKALTCQKEKKTKTKKKKRLGLSPVYPPKTPDCWDHDLGNVLSFQKRQISYVLEKISCTTIPKQCRNNKHNKDTNGSADLYNNDNQVITMQSNIKIFVGIMKQEKPILKNDKSLLQQLLSGYDRPTQLRRSK